VVATGSLRERSELKTVRRNHRTFLISMVCPTVGLLDDRERLYIRFLPV
jgi:hypothetical protein